MLRPEPVVATAFTATVATFRDLIEVEPATSFEGGRLLHVLRFSIAGSAVEVRCDDAAATAVLGHHYDAAADDGAPPAVRLVVSEAPAGVRFDGGSRAWLWPHGPLAAEAVATLADVAARVLSFSERDLLALHAAALAGPRGALALAAESGTGKSTTALAALELGMGLFSDEHCIVDRDDRLVPLARSLSLRGAGLRILAEETGRRPRFDGAVLVRPGAIPRDRFGWGDSKLRHIVVLERDPSAPPSDPVLEPLAPEAALGPLLDGVMCRERGVDRLARLLGLVRRCETWRLRAGTPTATARKLAGLVGVTA